MNLPRTVMALVTLGALTYATFAGIQMKRLGTQVREMRVERETTDKRIAELERNVSRLLQHNYPLPGDPLPGGGSFGGR